MSESRSGRATRPRDAVTAEQSSHAARLRDSNQLKITLISLHGLVRAHNPELGYDADTGGHAGWRVIPWRFKIPGGGNEGRAIAK